MTRPDFSALHVRRVLTVSGRNGTARLARGRMFTASEFVRLHVEGLIKDVGALACRMWEEPSWFGNAEARTVVCRLRTKSLCSQDCGLVWSEVAQA